MNVFQGNQQQDNPFAELENPDLRRKKEQENADYAEQVANATPEKTKQMKEEAGKILGKNFDPKTSIIDISQQEKAEKEAEISDIDGLFAANFSGQESPDFLAVSGVGKGISDTELGKDFSIENTQKGDSKENTQESLTEQIQIVKSDSPFEPIGKRLIEDGLVTVEAVNTMLEGLEGKSVEEQQKEFLVFVQEYINDTNIQQEIVSNFDSNNNQITEETFVKTKFAEHAKSLHVKLPEAPGGLEVMLAKNYIHLPDTQGKQNIEKDVYTAMDTTCNTIVTNNSIDFKQTHGKLIEAIHIAKNIEEKYDFLKQLHKEDLLADAKHGGKKGKEQIVIQKKELQNQAEAYSYNLKQAKLIKDGNERQAKLQELAKQKEKIIAEAQGVDSFAGDLDKISANIDSLGGGAFDQGEEKAEA